MPVTIGSKRENNFTDPIGLLTDCHRRIESFLSILQKVAEERKGQALEGEYRVSWEKALQYFRHAAPKHTADEEDSLFPRLKNAGGLANAAALGNVDQLHDEHEHADKLHRELDELGQKWLSEKMPDPSKTEAIRHIIQELADLYAKHIRLEEEAIFPLSAEVLSTAEKLEIGREMAERRSIQRPELSCATPL